MDMDIPYASAENTPLSSPRPYTEPSSPTSNDPASADSHFSYRNLFPPFSNFVCIRNQSCHELNQNSRCHDSFDNSSGCKEYKEAGKRNHSSTSPALPIYPTCPIRQGVGVEKNNGWVSAFETQGECQENTVRRSLPKFWKKTFCLVKINWLQGRMRPAEFHPGMRRTIFPLSYTQASYTVQDVPFPP